MKLFAAAALLLFPIAAFAQWLPQTWGCETDMWEYASHVDAKIDKPSEQSYLVSFTSLPSFEPEWGVRVGGAPGRRYIRIVVMRDQIYEKGFQNAGMGGETTIENYRSDVRLLAFEFPITDRYRIENATAAKLQKFTK